MNLAKEKVAMTVDVIPGMVDSEWFSERVRSCTTREVLWIAIQT